MASNDFFLNFGSNAKTWASGLQGELRPATSSITELTTALERYDSAVSERKGTGSPLDSLFTRLDSVSEKFADLTGSLGSTFDKAIQGIQLLQEDIAGLLRSVNQVTSASGGVAKKRGRPKIDDVDANDLESAARLKNMQALRVNTTAASKQVGRLAELNQTLALRAEEAGDKTIILRKAVGELVGASDKAIRGIDSLEARLSRFGEGVVINTPAGAGVAAAGGGTVDLAGLMGGIERALSRLAINADQVTIQNARILDQAEVSSKAVVDSAVETRRFVTTARSEQAGPQGETRDIPYGQAGKTRTYPVLDRRLDQTAVPGTYAVGNQAITFKQGDVTGNETFRQHIQRVNELKQRYERREAEIPTAASFPHGELLQRISENFLSSGGSSADLVQRAIKKANQEGSSGSFSAQDVIRGSNNRFVPGNLGKLNIDMAKKAGLGISAKGEFSEQTLVEQALGFTTSYRDPHDSQITELGALPRARREHIERFVGEELRQNPNQTFASLGSPEVSRVVKELFGQVINARGRPQPTVENLPKGFIGPPRLQNFADLPHGDVPEVLRGINPQALLQAAENFEKGLADRTEYSSTAGAKRSAERELQRRLGSRLKSGVQQQDDGFYDEKDVIRVKDDGKSILPRRGASSIEQDSTYTKDRLTQGYTAFTELGRLKNNVGAAKQLLASEQQRHPDEGGPREELVGKYREAVRAAEARLANEGPALQAQIDAGKKASEESAKTSRLLAARHDEITKNTRAAREQVKNLPDEVSDPLDDAAVRRASYGGLIPALKTRNVTVKPDAERRAHLQEQLAERQALLAQVQENPEEFRRRAGLSVEEQRAEQVAQAHAERDARLAQARKQLPKAESAYRAAHQEATEASAAAEAARQNLGLTPQELERRRIDGVRARRAGQEVEGLPEEAAAAAAQKRLNSAETRLNKLVSQLRPGGSPLQVPDELPPNPGVRFRAGRELTGPVASAETILKRLGTEIQTIETELAGTKRTRSTVTEDDRALAAEKLRARRTEQLTPILEQYGITGNAAKGLIGGTNEEVSRAITAAAKELDEAARQQILAAAQQEAAADRVEERQGKGKRGKGRKKGGDEEEVTAEATESQKGRRRNVNAAGDIAAATAERDALAAAHDETLARKQITNRALKSANAQGKATDEMRQANDAVNAEMKGLNQRLAALNTQIRKFEAAAARATEETATGGGGGRGRGKPPTPTGGGGSNEPDEPYQPRRRSAGQRSNDAFNNEQYLARFAELPQHIQDAVRTASAAAKVQPGATLTDEQKRILLPALHQFRDDPSFAAFSKKEDARRTFAAGAGFPMAGNVANQRFAMDGSNLNKGTNTVLAQQEATVARINRLEEIRLEKNVKIREQLLAQFAAEEHQAAVLANPNSTPGQIASADRRVSVSSRGVEAAITAADEETGLGKMGGLSGLLAHGGKQALRFMSFQIAFTGLEEVRKLVDTGIQAQTAFVRLQANLDATGRSAKGLSNDLGKISTDTAQPLEHTIQAASELTGVLKNRGDLLEGTKVASELANITHGMLTAHEAAVGLRDVTDAYGLSGIQAIRGVGDQITRISQVTGVSVKDVIEGTTQLAQEAHSFGLSQRQAAVLAAEVTKNTGETGSAAAEQVSRILSTFNNGKVQQLLEKTINPETGKAIATQEDFAGKVVNGQVISGAGDALTKLLAQYDQLAPQQRAAIDALVGSGRQARALTGMLRDAATSAQLLKDVSDDTGALAEQNSRTLHTLGGEFGTLGANFRRLGKDLLDAGIFDVIGIIVKGLDVFLHETDRVIVGLNALFSSNPLTKNLLHMGIVLAELSLAWKLFGKEARAAMEWVGFKGAAGALARGQEAGVGPMGVTNGAIRERVRGIDRTLAPSPARLFNSPIYNPGGTVYASEEQAAAMSAAERREAAMAARQTPIVLPVNRGEQMLGRSPIEQEAQSLARARTAVAIEGTAARMKTFGTAIAGVGASALSTVAPLAGFMLLLQGIQEAAERSAKLKTDTNAILDVLSPKPSKPDTDEQKKRDQAESLAYEATQQRRRWMGYSPGFDNTTDKGRVATAAFGLNPVGALMNGYGVITHPGDAISTANDLLHGDFSGGNISQKFNDKVDMWTATSTAKQGDAWNSPDALLRAQSEIDQDFETNARGWVKEAGDKYAQGAAAAYLIKLKQQMDDAAAQRLENLRGIHDIDILSLQQLESAATFVSSITSLDTRTLKADPAAMQTALEDTGVDARSKIGGILKKSLTDDTQGRVEDTIAFDKEELPQLEAQIAIKPLSDPDRDRLIKARDAVLANLQQQMTVLDQLATGNPAAMADLLTKVGNLEGASGQLKTANTAYDRILKTLDTSDPRFYQDISAMLDNETKIAQTKVQPGIDAANLDSARNQNPVTRARDSQKVAQLQLDAARDAAANGRADLLKLEDESKKRLADAVAAQSNFAANRPSNEGNPTMGAVNNQTAASLAANVASAQSAVAAASALVGVNDTEKTAAVQSALAAKAQADAAVQQSLQDQLVSANNLKVAMIQASGGGTLAMDAQRVKNANQEAAYAAQHFGKDSTEANNAAAAAIQAGIQQKQDQQNVVGSDYTLSAAIHANTGNNVSAAQDNLDKANSDLRFAIATYSSHSQEANQARVEVINANASLQQAIDDALNAALDLEISMLSNRGNDADKRQILKDKEKEAQNNLNAFKARGGDPNSAEGMRLQAAANDAHRNTIQQGVQIQIDTLDYMRETFQISSSQEVAALREILKNKQLTQDQVRAINLQILALQQQLSGEFNIGDIVKPTFYQARRSVQGGYGPVAPSAGAAGSAFSPNTATQSVTNNNNSTVTLNGVDFATVKKWVQSALGTTATSRYGTTQRKGAA